VGVEREPLDKVLQKVLREAEQRVDAELVSVNIEFF